MSAKDRLGNDPLSFITDTRKKEDSPAAESKPRSKRDTGKTRAKREDKLTRASFTLRESHLKKMRVQALRDGKQLKDILDDILTKHYKGKTISVKE